MQTQQITIPANSPKQVVQTQQKLLRQRMLNIGQSARFTMSEKVSLVWLENLWKVEPLFGAPFILYTLSYIGACITNRPESLPKKDTLSWVLDNFDGSSNYSKALVDAAVRVLYSTVCHTPNATILQNRLFVGVSSAEEKLCLELQHKLSFYYGYLQCLVTPAECLLTIRAWDMSDEKQKTFYAKSEMLCAYAYVQPSLFLEYTALDIAQAACGIVNPEMIKRFSDKSSNFDSCLKALESLTSKRKLPSNVSLYYSRLLGFGMPAPTIDPEAERQAKELAKALDMSVSELLESNDHALSFDVEQTPKPATQVTLKPAPQRWEEYVAGLVANDLEVKLSPLQLGTPICTDTGVFIKNANVQWNYTPCEEAKTLLSQMDSCEWTKRIKLVEKWVPSDNNYAVGTYVYPRPLLDIPIVPAPKRTTVPLEGAITQKRKVL